MLSWTSQSASDVSHEAYRLVALDLDSTLQPDGSIHGADAAAIRTAHAAGAKVVLVSARSPQAMHRYWAQLGLGTPVIALNGAVAYDFPGHQVVLGQPLPAEAVDGILAAARKIAPKATLAIECATRWGVTRLGQASHRQIEQTGIWPDVVGDISACRESAVYQLWIEAAGDQLDRLTEALADLQLALVRNSDPQMLLLRAPGASRGWALSSLATHLEVPGHQVMAIGGGGLDRSMVQAAAFTVLTSDAGMAPQQEADQPVQVTMTDGLAEALQLFVSPQVVGEEPWLSPEP